ncbi:hypothetical protein TKK_0014798 [Trichogramma kaykai]
MEIVDIQTNLAANHLTMSIIGQARVTFNLQDQLYNASVLLAPELREPLILGLPWLQTQKAIIDLERKVIHLGENERHTISLVQTHSSKVNLNEEFIVQNGFPASYQRQFKDLLSKHAHVISPTPGPLTQTNSVHQIKLTDTTPFRLSMYRYSDKKRVEIERQVTDMLAQGIIEPCVSPYSSPIVLAKKRNGTWRFCVDYRRLNSITEDSAQPIPRISDALKDLGDSKIFAVLDLKSGYWQIRLDKDARPLTAFSTPSGGTYQFKVMPFGLKGAPGTFQRLMTQEVLTKYLGKFCLVYLDDIIVYSKSYEDHLYHLSEDVFLIDKDGAITKTRRSELKPAPSSQKLKTLLLESTSESRNCLPSKTAQPQPSDTDPPTENRIANAPAQEEVQVEGNEVIGRHRYNLRRRT